MCGASFAGYISEFKFDVRKVMCLQLLETFMINPCVDLFSLCLVLSGESERNIFGSLLHQEHLYRAGMGGTLLNSGTISNSTLGGY